MTITTTLTNAELVYFLPPADGAQAIVDATTDQRVPNWGKEPHPDVQIENVRGKEDSVMLDTHGFQYGRHAAKHTAFADDAEVQKEYYPENIELVKQVTGASRVVIFDHSTSSARVEVQERRTDLVSLVSHPSAPPW